MKKLGIIALTLNTLFISIALNAQAEEKQGGPAVNATVFQNDNIKQVVAVTEVFGRSQRITSVIVEYKNQLDAASISPSSFAVKGRKILDVKVSNNINDITAMKTGQFVHIVLDAEDEASIVFSPEIQKATEVVVEQVQAIQSADGQEIVPSKKALINTGVKNLIMDDFIVLRYFDEQTGKSMDYNLYIPKDYDISQQYPLVLFMHDAGVTGSDPYRTLKQGLGAISFASPRDQAKHASFVLAPQYPVALANDEAQMSDYADMTIRLIKQLTKEYSIDTHRLYTTGQSGGCMTSIALNIKYPNFFAASLLVAGQWDAALVTPMANDNLWIIVSEDDAKAYPGMQAITAKLAENGAKVTQDFWNAKWSPQQYDKAFNKMTTEGADSNVFFIVFEKGSVMPENADSPAQGHMYTWYYAYSIPQIRDWLFEQTK
ncbi:MAG: hypothetical protein ACK5MJ_05280 [Alphaproteobacteria bacterium]